MTRSIQHLVQSVVLSTKRYLKFLSENGIGVSRFDINDIAKTSNQKIFIENAQWDEYRCFSHPGLSIKSDPALLVLEDNPSVEFEIRVIDYDRRTGRISFASQVDINCRTGVVLIDFRWLIQRCLDWYNKRSHELVRPEKLALVKFNRKFLTNPSMNQEQVDAIKTILTTPLSYIWGPPGTGKTQWVLSKSVKYCVSEDKRILVVASTNLAVDNALTAIIEDGV